MMTNDEITKIAQQYSEEYDGCEFPVFAHMSTAVEFARAIRNAALEEVAQRFDATGRDLAAADVRALKTKEGG